MIQYSIRCAEGHTFDSWFQSANAFDKLKAAGHVTCAQCGSADVEKAIMAPRVRASRNAAVAPKEPAAETSTHTVAAPVSAELQQQLAQFKRAVEENSDYVGDNFAKEARDMHLGDAPERSIYGQANAQEAKSLLEDGVPVLPLPFAPTRKTN